MKRKKEQTRKKGNQIVCLSFREIFDFIYIDGILMGGLN